MNPTLLFNLAMNGLLAVFFVALNAWALQNQLEETFVALALLYGTITVAANGFFFAYARQ